MITQAERALSRGYQLIRLIGETPTTKVWRAEAPDGRPVAIKVIQYGFGPIDLANELEALELFRAVKHPHLLAVEGVWSEKKQIVLASELADGTLRQRFLAARAEYHDGIPPDELLYYFRQAAEALDQLHREKKIHRNVKPENLLLVHEARPVIKVGDYGLLRTSDDDLAVMANKGTPPYMPPEVWERTPVPASDQFSLAVCYVELRQGRRPFASLPPGSMIDALSKSKADLTGLKESEQYVIRRAFALQPSLRYRTCEELIEELERALAIQPGHFRPSKPLTLASPTPTDPPVPTISAPPKPAPAIAPTPQAIARPVEKVAPEVKLSPAVPAKAPEPRTIPLAQPVKAAEPAAPAANPSPQTEKESPLAIALVILMAVAALSAIGWLVRGLLLPG
jgi:serine/threonine protein kinase